MPTTALAVGVWLGCVAVSFASCSVSATTVSFGAYAPLAGTSDQSTGVVALTCNVLNSVLQSWTISLSTGNSGTYSSRAMSNGTDSLDYQLYEDSADTIIWGDGTGGTLQVSGSATLQIGTTTTDYTVYGLIPGGQNVSPGSYTDTITVMVTY